MTWKFIAPSFGKKSSSFHNVSVDNQKPELPREKRGAEFVRRGAWSGVKQ